MIASRSVSSSPRRRSSASADRQVHVIGDRASLHLDGQALRLQPLALAGRARPQRPVRLELRLLGPGAVFVAAPQVRHEPFEPSRARAAPGRTAAPRAACAAACRRAPSGRCRSRGCSACSASRTSFRSPRAQGAIAPSASDFDSSGTTRCGSKSTIAPSPWQSGTGAVRRVERERPRRHLGHAQPAIDAGEPAREQPIAARRTS